MTQSEKLQLKKKKIMPDEITMRVHCALSTTHAKINPIYQIVRCLDKLERVIQLQHAQQHYSPIIRM